MKLSLRLAAIAVALSFSSVAFADLIEVSPAGSADCVNSPPCDFDEALDFADTNPGDDVLHLEPGVYDASASSFFYVPSGPTEVGGLTITGAGAVIDGGGINVGNPCLIIDTSALPQDGDSDILIANLTFQNCFTSSDNGAALNVRTNSASVTVHHVDFRDNFVTNATIDAAGGALAVFVGGNGDVLLASSNFDGNGVSATGEAGAAFIVNFLGNVAVTGNTFNDNFALDTVNSSPDTVGGALVAFAQLGEVTVQGNSFLDNKAGSAAGAMVAGSQVGETVLTDNVFAGNQTLLKGGSPDLTGGGALIAVAVQAPLTITNNSFSNNIAIEGGGGGMRVLIGDTGRADIYNNILWGNSAQQSTCTGTCNDVLIDDDPESNNVGAPFTVANNDYGDLSTQCSLNTGCVPGASMFSGNIHSDPMFVDASLADLRLMAGSPAIDAGNPVAPFLPAVDILGNPRVQGAAPDMGALESAAVAPPPPGTENCANNVDDDGDGKIDCNDPDCSGAAACLDDSGSPSENCANNVDDDGDTAIDCDDPDCSGALACRNTTSTGGQDGNNDGGSGQGQQSGDVTVNSGCALNPAAGNPAAGLWLILPGLMLAWRLLNRRRIQALLGLMLFAFGLGLSNAARADDIEVVSFQDTDCTDSICDLQTALDFAENNGSDDVLHLDDTTFDTSGGIFKYTPTENQSLTLIGAGENITIIDGGGVNPGIYIDTTGLAADSDADIVVEGITFQNGSSVAGAGGLDIRTTDADVTVRRCGFQYNVNQAPGSNFNFGGGAFFSFPQNFGSVTLQDSHFSHNTSTQSFAGGALIGSVKGQAVMEGNTFVANTTIDISAPSATTVGGGAVVVTVFGGLTVNRNAFLLNTSQAAGGLLAVEVFGNGWVTNNIFARNSAIGTGIPTFSGGGGLVLVAPEGYAALINNTIVENQAAEAGGGLLLTFDDDVGKADVYNNIIRGNNTGGALCTTSCNDIAVFDDADTNNIGNRITVANNDFSDIFFSCDPDQGCTSNHDVDAATNIDADPLFADSVNANFHLLNGSPAIDAGSALAPGLPALDFDKLARNQGTAPDMGAFESVPPPVTPPGPPTTENCANGVDDDQDGPIDCADPDCSGAAACQSSNPPPGVENCGNNMDDDGDGNIDCNDPDCGASAACQQSQEPGGDSGGDNPSDGEDGGGGDTTVTAGCALTAAPVAPSAWLALFLPLSWAVGRRLKGSKPGRDQ